MKKYILGLVVLVMSGLCGLNATIHTVSNDDNFPADYSNLQNAIDGAGDYDSIYIYGTGINYGNITIDKPLVLIGVGHNPQIQTVSTSKVGQIILTSAASNSTISGIVLNGSYGFEPATGTDNVTIENCYLYCSNNRNHIQASDCDNWIIRGNFIHHEYGNSTRGFRVGAGNDNWLITHNVFTGTYTQFLEGNQTTILSNNLIMLSNLFFVNSDQVIVSNNIMMAWNNNLINYNTGCTNCIYNHNLTWSNYADDNSLFLPVIPDVNNTGSNNLNNTDPLFETYVFGEDFRYTHDYHFQAGSPALVAGSDGTDIGIYGGISNFKFSKNGYPQIPRLYYMNITNTVLQEDGTLKIDIKGTTNR